MTFLLQPVLYQKVKAIINSTHQHASEIYRSLVMQEPIGLTKSK